MKPKPDKDFKALYKQTLEALQASLQQKKYQDNIIVILQDQLTGCNNHIASQNVIIEGQQLNIVAQNKKLAEQEQTMTLQHQTIQQQSERITQQDNIITNQAQEITKKDRTIATQMKNLIKFDEVKHELKMLKKLIFGRKSNKFYPTTDPANSTQPTIGEQLGLNLEVEEIAICNIKDVKHIASHLRVIKEVKEKVPHVGRHGFPEHLRREVTTIDVPNPPAGAVAVGVERQEQLAVRPMDVYVKVNERIIYIAPAAEKGKFKNLIAPLPPHPIPRCKVDISVLAMLAVEKYVYHIPVYRQRQRLLQYGVDIKYNTLNNLLNRSADVLEPLYDLHLKEVIRSGCINTDETTYRVLEENKRKGKGSHIGYMWGFASPLLKTVCFSYQHGRGKKDVHEILKDFKGFMMTDAYGVYKSYGKKKTVTHLQCLSHIRTYFMQARLTGSDAKLAEYVLQMFIQPLYAIEQDCKNKDLSYDEITEMRQTYAVPILDVFEKWLQEQLLKVTARTPIHKAIVYALNHFKELRNYTLDGMLPIDNNFIERAIRSIAMGRKNHLFAGSEAGAKRAAILYSLLGTCKLQGINPSDWLNDVLHRISIQPTDNYKALLPQYWKPLIILEDQQALA